jgi:hypothetical protein
MTIATELAKTNQRIEYLLCIEGISWPTNGLHGAISGGFDGDVFVTNDFNGTLASDLGCTIHETLNLTGSISASVDPKTAVSKSGGLSVKIQDDDWWLENYTPRKTGNNTTLVSAREYNDTTIVLTDGTNFANGDLVWIGGRELVLLAGKALIAGVVYQYIGSTRGYLGTPIGSTQRRPEDNIWNKWAAGTSVTSVARFWFNRQAVLYAHVPGEAVDNCVMLWSGKLRGIKDEKALSVNYNLDFVSDFMTGLGKKIRPNSWLVLEDIDNQIVVTLPGPYGGPDMDVPLGEETNWRVLRFAANWNKSIWKPNYGLTEGQYSLAAAYQYRTEPGGTDGMVTAWDSGTPQAADSGSDLAILGSHIAIGDSIYLLFKQDPTTATTNQSRVLASWADAYYVDPGQKSTSDSSESLAKKKATFLLNHWSLQKDFNRFVVNNYVTYHPIDIFLIFATSFDREFFRADTIAGSTTTVINFTVGTVGATNIWAGKALHCVEGANKGEARTIASNDADTITVDRAFSGAPAAAQEYQVRNSIYDVLPIGWGMGIDSNKIDIEEFEVLREKYFPGEEIDRFVLGAEGELDLQKFLQENILTPYGISLYFNIDTGKITPNNMGQAFDDGVVEDYEALTNADIIDVGDLSHSFTNPIGFVKLDIRKFLFHSEGGGGAFDKVETMYIRSDELESGFSDEETEVIKFKAMFDSERTVSPLIVRLYGLAAQYSIPPPVVPMTLDLAKYLNLYPGKFVSITLENVTNSYTGARNWTNVVGRVLDLRMQLKDQPVCTAKVEIFFGTVAGAKIAPAATVTAKGNDGDGDYFTVNTNDWANDNSTKDSYKFVTGDLIELRSVTGAWKESETIKGFGTAFTTGDASGTDGTRIYVVGAIASAIVAGDYVTFQPWSAANTARMDTYAAYADSAKTLAVTDPAKEYG